MCLWGICLVVRRCFFVDNHLSSMDELLDAEHDHNLVRNFDRDKPLRPLRPLPSFERLDQDGNHLKDFQGNESIFPLQPSPFCEHLEDQRSSLSISPESTSVLQNRRDESLSISPESTPVLENRRDETDAEGVISTELELMSDRWATDFADDLETWDSNTEKISSERTWTQPCKMDSGISPPQVPCFGRDV